MFIKVRPWDRPEGDTLIEVPASAAVRLGTQISKVPPKGRLYDEELDISVDFGHVEGIRDKPTGQESGSDYWLYRYAWWWEEGRGMVMVVTSGDIFVMSDTGQTVDRVR